MTPIRRTDHTTDRAASEPAPIRPDEVDRAILDRLQTDSKITNARLAELVGVSPATALERVRKLERAGLIRGYVAVLDPVKVGKPITALVSVTLREHGTDRLTQFKAALSAFDRIQSCWHMAGEADFVLKVLARDMGEYERFVVEELSAIPNIGRIQTSFVLDTVQDRTRIPLDSLE